MRRGAARCGAVRRLFTTHIALRPAELLGQDGLDGLGHLGVQTAAGLLLAVFPVRFLSDETQHFTV